MDWSGGAGWVSLGGFRREVKEREIGIACAGMGANGLVYTPVVVQANVMTSQGMVRRVL